MGIVMVTGGARSGKSTFAENIARESGRTVGYIATATVTDEDMRHRIERHKASRPDEWMTFERHCGFSALLEDTRFSSCDTLILDCLTVMIASHMFESNLDFDGCDLDEVGLLESRIIAEVDTLLDGIGGKSLIVVTNEVGQGIVPAYRMGSIFRDMAGRLNMHVAAKADEVYCMISGLPMKLK